MIKYFYIFLLIVCMQTLALFSQQKIPLVISSQNNTFLKIGKDIKKNLPENIEILVFDINFLNTDEWLASSINYRFKNTLLANQAKNKYSVEFIQDVDEGVIGGNAESFKNLGDLELISIGKYLGKDAILLSSITLVDDNKRKFWDKKTKKFQNRKIALFQGNFFSTSNNNSLYRFSYYFLVDI